MKKKYTVNVPRKVIETLGGLDFDEDGEACLISIRFPGDEPVKLKDGWASILQLSFWDVTKPTQGVLLAGHPDEIIYPLTDEDAKEIADFIKEHYHQTIIVHCAAGKSRSAGVVRLLTELGWTYDEDKTEWGLNYYNIEVYSKVKKHFPELLPSGAV